MRAVVTGDLRAYLVEDGWDGLAPEDGAWVARRDDGTTLRVVVLEASRLPRRARTRRVDRSVMRLLQGMSDPRDLHALALTPQDLPQLRTVPGRVWMQLGVRVYAVGAGQVEQQVIL